jgi:hypothetical protein
MKTMAQTVSVRTITGPDALHDLLDQVTLIQLDGHHQGCKHTNYNSYKHQILHTALILSGKSTA